MNEQGSMMFSHKALAKIIIPLALQNLLAVAIGMIDSIMVSGNGPAAFAGVSLIGSLDILLITLFSSLTTGGSVVLAQAMGRGEREHASEAAKQLVYVATACAALISTVVLLLRVPLLRLLFGEVEADVMQNALAYFSIMAFSFPFLAIENSVSAMFRAQGDSMISLKISLFMNLLNIGGNAFFIYAMRMGAAGAALATLISRMIGAAVMLALAHEKKRYIYITRLLRYRPSAAIIKEILHIGVPNSIENSMFQFGRLLTASLVSTLGTVAINANSAALALANFQYNAGGAIQGTMVAVVGRCIGAKEKEQARHYSPLLLWIGYALILAVVLLLCLFSAPLLRLFHLTEEAFPLARMLLFVHSAVSIVLWPLAFCLPSAFRAARDVRFTMLVSVGSMWVFRVALAYLLAPTAISPLGWFTIPCAGLGIIGVYIAMSIDWVCRFFLFLWRFVSGKWLCKADGEKQKTS